MHAISGRYRPSHLGSFALCLTPLLLAGCGGGGGDDDSGLPTVAALTATCTDLVGQTLAGVTVTAATRVEPVANVSTAGFCKVSGTRAPFLDIEVDLPDNWSGRYFQQGGGGFNGTIPTAVTTNASGVVTGLHPTLGFKAAVYAASNGGNRAAVPAQAAPNVWTSGTAEGQASANDYSYQSLGTTLGFAKELIARFFGKPATYRYFNGCSNGGREAYIVTQRWPNDYDGVVSGCETGDMAGQTAGWLDIGKRAGSAAALTGAQYTAAYASAVAACDAQDGLVDGYLANPATCKHDPALLLCGLSTASVDPALCLSAPQVQTLRDIMSPVALADGTVIYSGFNWSDFSSRASQFNALGGGFAFLGTGDAAWLTAQRQAAFDLNTDYARIGLGLQKAGADHDRNAIAAFVVSGKKLISWHALGDNLLSPNDHARNDALLATSIKSMGLADPSTGMRYLLVPANNHGAGAVLSQVDWASAIMDWVEKGAAPSQLTYTFTPTGAGVARSLPVCLSPLGPKYNGSGDVNVATSYSCV